MPRNVFEIKEDEDEELEDARFAAALDDPGLERADGTEPPRATAPASHLATKLPGKKHSRFARKAGTDGTTPPERLRNQGPSTMMRLSTFSTTSSRERMGVAEQTSGSNTYRFRRGPSGTLLGTKQQGGRNYYVPDAPGSTVAITDSSGAVANSYTYEPYSCATSPTTRRPGACGSTCTSGRPPGFRDRCRRQPAPVVRSTYG